MTYITQIEPQGFLAGQIANSDPVSMITQPNTDTVAIPFGIAMIDDSTNQGYKLPAASGDITNRMAVNMIIQRNTFFAYDSSFNPLITNNTSVSPGNNCAGCTFGYIAVTVEEAVNLGDICYIRYASGGGGTQLGAFRKSADTSTAAAHPTWYYASAATSGSKAIVRVA